MFMGHLDVVPANPEGWRYPPFGGVIAEGRLWGRGSLDMLGQTAAMAVAAAEIAVSNRSLRGDLLFLGVADEEAAGTYGARWLTENHWEKVKADYMITELGGFYLDLPGSPRAILTVGEKGVAQVRVNARGQASHGSLPFGVENATLKIARAAALLGPLRPPRYWTDFIAGSWRLWLCRRRWAGGFRILPPSRPVCASLWPRAPVRPGFFTPALR